MNEIILNDNNLHDNDISEIVIRVKGLLINSDNKLLLAFNNNTYQFPGGHLEKGEEIVDCLIREIKEETGINITITEEPFLVIKTYDNNYFGSGKKVLNIIYYFRVFCDELPNFSETHYDELEQASEFNLYYVPFNDLGNFLKNGMNDGMLDLSIGREMLNVLSVYNDVYGG